MIKNCSLIILAGGQSKRMNYRDKFLLPYGDKTFISKILKECKSFDKIILSLNSEQEFFSPNIKIICDYYKEIGPLGGLHASLKALETDFAIVIPCDMPYISSDLLNYLSQFITSSLEAIIIRDNNNKINPLFGIYHKNVLPKLEEFITNGNYKATMFLSFLKTKEISLEHTVFNNEKTFLNINTCEEYKNFSSELKKPVFFAVSGSKNSGKTTFIQRLIKDFVLEGKKVGTIKHDGHDLIADVIETDSFKHREAGSSKTIVFSKSKFILIDYDNNLLTEDFLNFFLGYDLVILEGFKHSNFLKIELIREDNSTESVCKEENLMCIVSDINLKSTVPVFNFNNLEGIIKEIKKYIFKGVKQ
ncbi:MAG: molybdopterin-guanine dinucleotide biosynthesis protein B [Fusobacteriaceae bacterium]